MPSKIKGRAVAQPQIDPVPPARQIEMNTMLPMRRYSFASNFLALAICLLVINQAGAVDYGKEIAPLWKRSCVACHNSKKSEGGLNLESAATLLKGGDSGAEIVAGKSAESELILRLVADDDTKMPPPDNSAGAKPLSAAEIELVKKWIDAGAMPGEESGPTAIAWQSVPAMFRPVYAVDASADGQFIASGRGNHVVVYPWPLQGSPASAVALIDPQTVADSGMPSAHLDVVQSLAFSPDAQTLATGGFRCVKLWKRDFAATSLVGLKPTTGLAALAHDGRSLAIAREDRTVDIVDLATRQTRLTVPAGEGPVTALEWTGDDQNLFVADQSNKVTRWQLPAIGAAPQVKPVALGFSSPSAVKALAPLAADRVALLASDGQLSLWVVEAPAPAAAATAATAEGTAAAAPSASAGEGAAATATPASTTAANFVKKDFAEAIPPASAIAACAGNPVRLIVAHGDGQMEAVHAVEGKVLAKWKSPVAVSRLAAHPQGSTVASLGADASVRLWNAADGKELVNIAPETALARDVARGQRGVARQQAEVDRLAATIKTLETAHQKEQEAMKKVAEEREKAAAALAAKVAACDANTTAIQESEKGIAAAKQLIAEQTKRIEQLTADIEAKKKKDAELAAARQAAMEDLQKQDQTLASSKDAVDRAAKAIPDQQAVVEQAKQKLTSFQAAATELSEAEKKSREEAPVAFAFNAAGDRLLLGRQQGSIAVLDVAAGRLATELKAPPQLAAVIGTGHTILAANSAQPLTAWNSDAVWKLERVLGSETDPNSLLSDRVTALAFSPDGQTLAVGSGPASRFGDVKLFRVSDGSVLRDLGEVHSDTVLDIAFSPDGNELATCAADKLVRVFDLVSGQQRLSLEGHTHHVLSVAWQDSGRTLASASADGTIKLWDSVTGEQQRTVSGFGKEITSVAFVGQTSQLLATCADNSLRLVETTNGQTVRNFAGSTSALYALAIAADGKHVVAGGQDGKLIIWTIDKAAVVKQLE
jgi:WD40 repeat protein